MSRGIAIPTSRGPWAVMVVLLAAVLVPTACVLLFMRAAMDSERLAVRQRIADLYRQYAETKAKVIADAFAARTAATARFPTAAQSFESIVRDGRADSAIVLAGDDSTESYPRLIASADPQAPPALADAARLEKEGDLPAAAEAYGRVAHHVRPPDAAATAPATAPTSPASSPMAPDAIDIPVVAQALAGQIRCLLRAGKLDDAKDILHELTDPKYRTAADSTGRLIAPGPMLLAMQTMPDRLDNAILGDLADRVNDYSLPMPSSQRLFLMNAALELNRPGGISQPPFPARAGEELAARYLERPQPAAATDSLGPTALPGIWQMPAGGGRIILLFDQDTLLESLRHAAALGDDSPKGARLDIRPPGGAHSRPFLAVPIAAELPGWEVTVTLVEDPFAEAMGRQNTLYLAGGLGGIVVIALLATVVAGYIGRQMRLTRLKNDLIATVSHELKTPLASIRVLVDTLADGRCSGERQAREYLQLIAKENERLSRLIDNFLTFSRMERNKRSFHFETVAPADLVASAVAAVQERFDRPAEGAGAAAERPGHGTLEVDCPPDLPPVTGDREALISVLVNLLDNAWKYTGPDKRVRVSARAEDGDVLLSVEDNGIGLSRREVRRIFDRFYQVDRSLSRRAGGCGLGLSIVKFILDAHGASIDVKSQSGKGSTFTVRLNGRNQ